MQSMTVHFDIPDHVEAEGFDRSRFAERVRRTAVLELVRDGMISEGRAAEMLRIPRAEIVALLQAVGPNLTRTPSDDQEQQAAQIALDRSDP